MAVKVGTFAKSTAAASVDQAITGAGFTPMALLLWTAGCTDLDTYTAGVIYAFGMTGEDKGGGAIAFAAADAAATSTVQSRQAAKALTIIDSAGNLLAECVVKTWDSSGVTLTWTTNNASAYTIHYMLLGGADLTEAYVKQYLIATGTTGTDVGVTGVGFQPDAAIHSTIWAGSTADQTIASAQPSIGVQMPSTVSLNVGGMTRDGQAATVAKRYGYYNTASAAQLLRRNSLTSAYGQVALTAGKSLDADGFTFTVTNDPVADCYAYALCLKGGAYAGGLYQDNDASEAVTGLVFEPEGVLMLSVGEQSSSGTPFDDLMLSIGAFTATAQTCAAVWDDHNLADSNNNGVSSNSYAALYVADGASSNSMAVTSIESDGFAWTQATSNFGLGYLALNLGAAPAATAPPWLHYRQMTRGL